MLKNQKIKLITLLSITVLLAVAIMPTMTTSALVPQNSTSWFWGSDTKVAAVAVGDLDGNGQNETITVGWYNDGLRWNAQIIVWDSVTLSALRNTAWNWGDTQVSSVAVGNVDADAQIEIVTGGSFFDGTRWVAQLIVWNGLTLVAEKITAWYWTGDTQVSSVAVGDADGDGAQEIVTGGSFFDGTRDVAQLIVWNGATLVAEKTTAWFWTGNTYITTLAVANVTGGTSLNIVTGGSFFDGTRDVAQLIVWNGATLVAEKITAWYWTSNTYINSVAVANVTGGTSLNIVTGGSFFDGTRDVAQLIVWNGATLVAEKITAWYWTSTTTVNSITIGNFTGGSALDIITAGSYNDGLRNNAQVIIWNSSNLIASSVATWFTTNHTNANSVAMTNFGLSGNRIVVGGAFYDGVRENAQIVILS